MYFFFGNLLSRFTIKPVSLKMPLNQSRDQKLKERWEKLVAVLSDRFSDGEALDVEGILYLVGLQELGQVHRKMKKDDNVNLIHIGICAVLEPFGYYRFDYIDDEGWPHFELLEELPPLKPGEQSVLMKEALVSYFLKRALIQ
ncbi:MAG: Uncharacterised protein [Flavobacteriaceae bacterium]|nr:MAG: Uncharacterised protein [Flavobacteriaceae bacterium]